MFDRFSDHSKKAMTFAREQAIEFGHDYIDTEHLLLAVLHVGSGVTMRALELLGVSPPDLRHAVHKVVRRGSGPAPRGQLPFTVASKHVLEYSMDEAGRMGVDYIGTEHLLLGLVRETKGIAGQALRQLGVGIDAARAQVAEILRAGGADRPETELQRAQVEVRATLDRFDLGERAEHSEWFEDLCAEVARGPTTESVADEIEDAIRALPASQREIIVLRDNLRLRWSFIALLNHHDESVMRLAYLEACAELHRRLRADEPPA